MSMSKVQQKAVNKYVKENYEEIKVRVKKGYKSEIKAHANMYKESINSFIGRAIEETIKRDNLKIPLSDSLLPTVNIGESNQSTVKTQFEKRREKQEKYYKPFTETDEEHINFSELLTNIKYQVNIADTYGIEVLSSLIEKARQKAAEINIAENNKQK